MGRLEVSDRSSVVSFQFFTLPRFLLKNWQEMTFEVRKKPQRLSSATGEFL